MDKNKIKQRLEKSLQDVLNRNLEPAKEESSSTNDDNQESVIIINYLKFIVEELSSIKFQTKQLNLNQKSLYSQLELIQNRFIKVMRD